MQTSSWITLVLVAGVVWGGLAVLLALALRKEARKEGSTGAGGGGAAK